MGVQNDLKGARLEFVLRPIKGKRERTVHSWDAAAKKLVTATVEDEPGYMLFLPTGQSYRLSQREAVKRNFLRQPAILNFDGVSNASTPAGRFKFAINDEARKKAWAEMEQEVVNCCKRRAGGNLEAA